MAILEGQLLAVIVCPECFQIMRGPILLCSRGHSLCSSCRETRDNCSVCHGHFTGGRNYLAENIIANIFIQSFKDIIRTKTSSTPSEQTLINEIKYSYSMYFCRVCGNYIDFNRLVPHFEMMHPANILKNGKSRLVRKREVNASFIYTCQIEFHGQVFWFWRRNEGKFVHFGLQYVGGGVSGEYRVYCMDVISPDREMLMRYQARVPIPHDVEDERRQAALQHGVVSAHLLGEGARFSITII